MISLNNLTLSNVGKLFLMSISAFSVATYSQQAVQERLEAPVTGFATIGDQLAGGRLTPENESLIRDIFKKMGVTSNIRLARAIESFAENHPNFRYVHNSPLLGHFYVNEPWFNSLSEQEKRFVIGRAAADMTTGHKAQEILKYALLGSLYGYVGYKTYTTLERHQFNGTRLLSKIVSGMEALAAMVGTRFFMNKLVLNPIGRYQAYKTDKQVAQKLDCLDGAVSVLKKMHADTQVYEHLKDKAPVLAESIKRLSTQAKTKK